MAGGGNRGLDEQDIGSGFGGQRGQFLGVGRGDRSGAHGAPLLDGRYPLADEVLLDWLGVGFL